MLEKGYVHVYTGTGKGKTTAMLGLMLRAVGAGLRVYIGQFVKSMAYSEVRAIEDFLPGVTIERYGLGCFLERKPTSEDAKAAEQGLDKITQAILSGEYDIVMMDEVNVAITLGLLDREKVLEVIGQKPENIELILTGRSATPEIIHLADLVSEINEVKHYHNTGVLSREGIDR